MSYFFSFLFILLFSLSPSGVSGPKYCKITFGSNVYLCAFNANSLLLNIRHFDISRHTWKRCKKNNQNLETRALIKMPVGWLSVERCNKRHLVAQVCSTNGLCGIFKFSEILDSNSYYFPLRCVCVCFNLLTCYTLITFIVVPHKYIKFSVMLWNYEKCLQELILIQKIKCQSLSISNNSFMTFHLNDLDIK